MLSHIQLSTVTFATGSLEDPLLIGVLGRLGRLLGAQLSAAAGHKTEDHRQMGVYVYIPRFGIFGCD